MRLAREEPSRAAGPTAARAYSRAPFGFGLCLAVFLLFASSSFAESSAARGQLLAVGGGPGGTGAACFSCHGIQGEGDSGAGFPRLAGLDAQYLAKQMEDYRSGARPNRVMSPIAQQLDAEDYRSVALYYASLRARMSPFRLTAADGLLLQQGGILYARGSAERGIQACANCHGPGARGLGSTYPAIVQPSAYTDAQLRLWRAGVRRNDINNVMGSLSRRMTDEDIRSVAAYLAELPP
jgi:cytochrome c553